MKICPGKITLYYNYALRVQLRCWPVKLAVTAA